MTALPSRRVRAMAATWQIAVGAQPTKGQLVRALADMHLVGVEGYRHKYVELVAQLERAEETISGAGMTLVHRENRIKGSTVLAVEDPSALVTRRMKKLGHSFAYLYNLHPEQPQRTQSLSRGIFLRSSRDPLKNTGAAAAAASRPAVYHKSHARLQMVWVTHLTFVLCGFSCGSRLVSLDHALRAPEH